MRVIRLFHPVSPQLGDVVSLLPPVAHKVAKVLRMRVGDEVSLVCGDGMNYVGHISSIEKNATYVEIQEIIPNDIQPALDLHLYIALLKGNAMDWVLQKSVELGVTHIIPMETERSERRFDEKRWAKKSQHWQEILIAASLQCGRSDWVNLSAPQKLSDGIATSAQVNIICSPHDKSPSSLACNAESVAIMIGPEGGFSPYEVNQATEMGWHSMVLGKRILRADTAAVVALSMAQMFYGDFSL